MQGSLPLKIWKIISHCSNLTGIIKKTKLLDRDRAHASRYETPCIVTWTVLHQQLQCEMLQHETELTAAITFKELEYRFVEEIMYQLCLCHEILPTRDGFINTTIEDYFNTTCMDAIHYAIRQKQLTEDSNHRY